MEYTSYKSKYTGQEIDNLLTLSKNILEENKYINTISNQEIDGIKTFNDYIFHKNNLFFQEKTINKGIYFSPNVYGGININNHDNGVFEKTIGYLNNEELCLNKFSVNYGYNLKLKSILISESGWYRVAEFGSNDTFSGSCILCINRDYYYADNESYTLSINRLYNNKVNIIQLSGLRNYVRIPKIRVLTKNDNISYIEIYYNASNSNNISINGIGNNFNVFSEFVKQESIPDEYVSTEFTLGTGIKNNDEGLISSKLTTKQLTNEDLNDLKDTKFSSYFAFYKNNCINVPFTDQSSFGLMIQKYGNGVQQILVSEKIFTRSYNGVLWSEWKKMLTENDLTDIKNRLTVLENK